VRLTDRRPVWKQAMRRRSHTCKSKTFKDSADDSIVVVTRLLRYDLLLGVLP